MYSKDCEKYEYAYVNGEDGEEEEGKHPLDSTASRFLEAWVRVVSQFHCDGKVG